MDTRWYMYAYCTYDCVCVYVCVCVCVCVRACMYESMHESMCVCVLVCVCMCPPAGLCEWYPTRNRQHVTENHRVREQHEKSVPNFAGLGVKGGDHHSTCSASTFPTPKLGTCGVGTKFTYIMLMQTEDAFALDPCLVWQHPQFDAYPSIHPPCTCMSLSRECEDCNSNMEMRTDTHACSWGHECSTIHNKKTNNVHIL